MSTPQTIFNLLLILYKLELIDMEHYSYFEDEIWFREGQNFKHRREMGKTLAKLGLPRAMRRKFMYEKHN